MHGILIRRCAIREELVRFVAHLEDLRDPSAEEFRRRVISLWEDDSLANFILDRVVGDLLYRLPVFGRLSTGGERGEDFLLEVERPEGAPELSDELSERLLQGCVVAGCAAHWLEAAGSPALAGASRTAEEAWERFCARLRPVSAKRALPPL